VEPRKAETREATREAEPTGVLPGGTPGDDAKRFLRELRQLRDVAGLGLAELAARAHYPYHVLQSAETGPGLPDLPVLSAYVRGCGGVTAEWEERWRSLTRSPASPLLPTRPAGCSDAATAGARVGTSTASPDDHDPARIMAALDRVADGMAAPTAQAAHASPPGSSGSAVPGMRLPPTADAARPTAPASAQPAAAPASAQPAAPASAQPAAAPGLVRPSTAGSAGSPPGVVSALTARTPAGRARGTVAPRAIAALVAIALFLVGLVVVFAH
jgi:hypothetical protein